MEESGVHVLGKTGFRERLPEPPSRPGLSTLLDAVTHEHWSGRLMRAIVESNDGSQVYIRRPGYATADAQSYPKLAGVSPSGGDEVLIIDVTGKGGWVVLGQILRNP